GVAGWGGSRPGRVGNGAKEQVQYDAVGFVVDALSTCARAGARLTPELRAAAGRIADRAREGEGEPSSGIWELREPADLVSADIGRWLAVDGAVRLARRPLPWAG